jgi:mersacidin/lichenicidin family type 2 lantibiotic
MGIDVIRSWKDPEYRKTLTPEELSSLPPNPPEQKAELNENQMGEVAGGRMWPVKG